MASNILYVKNHYLNFFKVLHINCTKKSLKAYGFVAEPTNVLAYAFVNLLIFIDNIVRPVFLDFSSRIIFFLDFIFIVFKEFYKNFIPYHSESYEKNVRKMVIKISEKESKIINYPSNHNQGFLLTKTDSGSVILNFDGTYFLRDSEDKPIQITFENVIEFFRKTHFKLQPISTE